MSVVVWLMKSTGWIPLSVTSGTMLLNAPGAKLASVWSMMGCLGSKDAIVVLLDMLSFIL